MPGGDQSGPMGMGPMTGRGAGFCSGAGAPGFMNRGGASFAGGGRGRGGRGGRGWRNMFYATGLPGWARAGVGAAQPVPDVAAQPDIAPTTAAPEGPAAQQELDALKRQAEQAAGVLQSIRQRIDELESTSEQ